MYSQQQVESPSQQSPTWTQSSDLVSGALACEQEAGNQAALDQAGLTGGSVVDAIFDGIDAFVLECLPLEAALPMAASRLDQPEICAWAQQQDPARVVQALSRVMPDLLAAQWPAGQGLVLSGALGGALGIDADLEGNYELIRLEDGTVRATASSTVEVGLADMGARLAAKGGGEEAIASLGATLKGGVAMDLEAVSQGGLVTTLLTQVATGAGPLGVIAMLSGQRLVAGAADLAGLDLPDLFAPSSFQWETRSRFDAEGKADASGDLLDLLPVDLAQAASGLAGLLESFDGILRLSSVAKVELVSAAGAAALRIETGPEGVVELAGLPGLASVLPIDQLQLLASRLSGSARLGLDASIQVLDGLSTTIDATGARMYLSGTRAVEGDQQTDRIDFHLSDLPTVVAALGNGEGLSALVKATGFAREVSLAIPDDQLQDYVPDVAAAVARYGNDAAAIAGSSTVHLEGQLVASQAVMQVVADSGIQAPAELGALAALADVHSAIVALVTGGASLPTWLLPYSGVLEQAAGLVALTAPRVKGTVTLGVGGELSVTGGTTVGTKHKGSVGISVDREATGLDATTVFQALAQGVAFGGSSYAPAADQPTCQVEDPAPRHAETGTSS